jgi:hypothetical protein
MTHASFTRHSIRPEILDGGDARGREHAIARSLGFLLEEMVTRRDLVGAAAIADQLAGQLRKLDGVDP